MKKTITCMAFALAYFGTKAQTTVADFENLTLAADTFYENHSSASWQTSNGTFRYGWDTTYDIWDAGFAYTNKNNIITGTYHNEYAAITGKGFNNSNNYVAAWQGYGVEKMRIKLASTEKSVLGFYATNSTYGYKIMQNGDGFARKFGDTLHTHSGLQPGNYPDWFRLDVYGYKNGVKKTDTVKFYLADFRFSDNSKDYIVNTWKWVDCSTLGNVDSVSFQLFSSDTGAFGINNPTYFCMDNFSTSTSIVTGLTDASKHLDISSWPNPFNSSITVFVDSKTNNPIKVVISDFTGKAVYKNELQEMKFILDLNELQSGIYFLELNNGEQKTIKKIIKN